MVADLAAAAYATAATINTLAYRDANGRMQVATPSAAADVANKGYVDAFIQGLDTKASMRLATAAALPANTRTGNVLTMDAVGALTVDGVAVALNDRILVQDEATGANNGLYYVSVLGDGSTAAELTRTEDADADAKVTSGLYTFVSEGTANAGKGFTLITADPITLNTTALSFTQFNGAGTYDADGTTITLTGTTFSLTTGVATPGTYGSVTVDTYGRVTAGTNPVTGYTADFGDNAATSFNIDHNLGTKDVQVVVRDNTTGAQVITENDATTTNRVVISGFVTAPTTDQYRVIVAKVG